MIKLRAIGKVTRLFTIIWIQMMAIPIEMLNLAPYREGCSQTYVSVHTHTHLCAHTHLSAHTHTSVCTHTHPYTHHLRIKLNIPDKNNTTNCKFSLDQRNRRIVQEISCFKAIFGRFL